MFRRDASQNSSNIKYMRTQVQFDPSEVQVRDASTVLSGVFLTFWLFQRLKDLGFKEVSKPSECTHLIASHIGRTEKFLLAMPAAPFIVTRAWVDDCVKQKRILRESDAALRTHSLMDVSWTGLC